MHGHRHARTDPCDEYRQSMAGRSDQERRKAAEAHIVRMYGSADEAHIERHLRRMQQRCGGASPG